MAKKGGAPTKSEIVATICKDSELSRKQVAAVFESLNGIIKKSVVLVCSRCPVSSR
jgi:nucleoid DNA-binding protein